MKHELVINLDVECLGHGLSFNEDTLSDSVHGAKGDF